jgi:hypothetical protein
MKINVDASFTEGAMTGGWDFVVQNEAGEIECAGVGKINAVSSPLQVEAIACLQALRCIAEQGMMAIEIETLQLFTLKAILNTFDDSTDLKVNYSKSSLYPINISKERLYHLAATFHCKAVSLPFTYLGLPLCMNKPTVQDCLPLVDRVERRVFNNSLWLT